MAVIFFERTESSFDFRYAIGLMPTAHLKNASSNDNKNAIENAVKESGYDGELAVVFYEDEIVHGIMWPSGLHTGWGIETERRLTYEERDRLKKLQLKPMYMQDYVQGLSSRPSYLPDH
jgi:hypothetical protein